MNLKEFIDRNGRFPPVAIHIKPIWKTPAGTSVKTAPQLPTTYVSNFLEYEFEQSVLVPADTFSFTWAAPQEKNIWSDYFREGDVVQLSANDQTVATGLIDDVDIELAEDGERISVRGRDLMSQFEDQDAVNVDSTIIFGQQMTAPQVFQKLQTDTRIPGFIDMGLPSGQYLFATEPQESKLSALQRFLEPLNCIAWMAPDGRMNIGKPSMGQTPVGTFTLDHSTRFSNCIGMRASFASATIPNMIVGVFAGQEQVQGRVPVNQRLENAAEGPARLLAANHRVLKCVVVSNPTGGSAQDLSKVNAIAASRPGMSTLVQGYVKREFARRNVNELIVQVTAPGHYAADGSPLRADTVWNISFPKALKAPLKMYCYAVKYTLKPGEGQRTYLSFCKLGSICADIPVGG